MLSLRRLQRAFTLVELLVSVAVLAIGASLAAPAAMQSIARSRVQAAAQNVLDGINLARTEAVRRNLAVRFALRADGLGWTVSEAGSGTALQSYQNPDWLNLTFTPGGTATGVTFLPTGLRATGTQLSQLTVASPVEAAGTRRINVFGGGLIRMCDPGVTTADDPRRC